MKRLRQWLYYGLAIGSIYYIKYFVFRDISKGEYWAFGFKSLSYGVLIGLGFFILEPLFKWRTWRKGGKLGPSWFRDD